MTQLLYLLGSLAGVAALVGLCVLLFGRAVAKIDAVSAEDALRADVPGFRLGAFAASDDGSSALALDARDDAAYLIVARGHGLAIRKLSRQLLRRAARDGAILNLRLSDFTFPKARIVFAEQAAALEWENRLATWAA